MSEHVTTNYSITYKTATQVIQAGLEKAEEMNEKAAIVVTDANGEIRAVAYTEDMSPRGWRGGLAKASVAATMGISTQMFLEKRLTQDEVLWKALSNNPDNMFVPGGIPLKYKGKSVGGVGVSGGHYMDDVKVAQAVADAFTELVGE